MVGDKNCEKIHYMAPNIYTCGAGTAADCDHVTGMLKSLSKSAILLNPFPLPICFLLTKNLPLICLPLQTEMIKRELELHRLNTHSENRVQMAANRLSSHAFSYGGHIGTHLIIGGVDCKGPQIIEVSNCGHSKQEPYATTGSGSLAAMAIMETQYKDNMTQEECVALCVAAIEAGIYHDLGSGSNVDVCIIKRGKTEYLRNYKHDNSKIFSKPDGYKFREERVKVLEEYRHKIAVVENAEQPMQLN